MTLVTDEDALVPVRDPLELAAVITRYLDDNEKRAALAARLMAEARSKFNLATMCDATENLYLELLRR
jgi:glycosyltransferase involved in cell wall biosynthesis